MDAVTRLTAALHGTATDRPPVVLHNFLHAARRCAITQTEYRTRPEAMARAMLTTARDFSLDGIVVDMDTAVLAEACGAAVDHPDDVPARVRAPRFAAPGEVHGLPPPDITDHPRVRAWVEGVRLIKRAAGPTLWVRGNCDQAPFSLAAEMCAPEAFLMALLDPDQADDVRALLEWCAVACRALLTAMAASGCDALSNGDSTSGPDVVAPRAFRRWARSYHQDLAAHAHGLGLPWVIHVCGNTTAILDDLMTTGADAVELDYKTDLDLCHAACHRYGRTLFGNLDPSGLICRGTPAEVRAGTSGLLSTFAGGRLVVGAGCALPAETPDANVHALVNASRQLG